MAKADLEEMGESTDGLANSSSKMRDEIKSLTGVDIMLDDKTFKSTAQIIQEIGEVWENLTDVSQAAVLEKLAGKNRASTVMGLIENYKVIGEVIESAENAEGSALKENEAFLDSIEGKIQQFTNEVQEFWYNLISSDTVKAIIDVGTTIVDVIGNVVDKAGALGDIGILFAGGLGFNKLYKNLFKKGEEGTWVDELLEEFTGGLKNAFTKENIEKRLDSVSNLPSLKDFISGLFTSDDVSIDGNPIVDAVSTVVDDYEDWTDAYLDWNDTSNNLNSILDPATKVADAAATEADTIAIKDNTAKKIDNIAATEGSVTATGADAAAKVADTAVTEGATAANGLFAKSLVAIKAAAPYLLAAAAAIAAVVITVKAIDEAIETAAEANEKFENSKEAYENTKSELESLNSELDETKSRIEELNSLDKLTVTEKDELKTLEAQRRELETQIELKEKLAKKQQKQTAEDAYNAINHSQTVTNANNSTYGSSNTVRYDTKVDKIGASVSEYTQLLEEQAELETKLAGMNESDYADTPLWKENKYETVSNKLQEVKDSASELFDSLDVDINELREQRDSLFDDNGELIDESYRTTADAIERLIIQFSNTGEASDLELKLFDTFHPEQISDKISEIDDSLEITQDNLGATEEEFEKLAEKGVLSVDYIKDHFPNLVTAAEAAGLPLEELVEHFEAVNRAAIEATESGSKGLYSIKDIIDDSNSAFNQAVAAQETANMGATYDTMYEQYKTAKELLEKGDIGTDDFKKIAAMFSPTGATDAANFKENSGKIKRYFTEDNTGVLNFLNDLKKHDLATYNKETKEWSYSIGDLEEAAKKLGIGFEPMMAIFGELNDKGFYNDFFSTTEAGTAHLLDLQEQLQTAEDELQNLYDTDPKNSTAIQAKIDEIDTLKGRITETTDALAELINEDPEEKLEKRKKKKKELKKALESYNANYETLNGTEDGRAVLEEWKAEIEQYVAENGFTLEVDVDGKLKIGNVKEASEEAEEESKENPVKVSGVKVSGVADKYRVNQSNQYSNDDKTKTALLNKVKAENFGMTPKEMKKYADKYLKTGEDKKGLILKTFSGKNTPGMASGYKHVNKKVLDVYNNGGNLKYDADQKMNMIERYTFEDLSSIDFNDDNISDIEAKFIALADTFGITKDEYEWFIEYLKDNDYIQVDTASAVESIEELQNYLSDGDYEKVVELVGEDNASGIVTMWNTLSANDKFSELSAEDKATEIINHWNELTPEEKEVVVKGGEQADTIISNITQRLSEAGETTLLDTDDSELNQTLETATSVQGILNEINNSKTVVNIKDTAAKTAKNVVNKLKNLLNEIDSSSYDTTVTVYQKLKQQTEESNNNSNPNPTVENVDGTSANGTVNGFANGIISAHANGTRVAIQKDETALVNEVGQEGIVRSGKLYEIPGGAQKIHLKRGDIIFNHKQMAELKEKGYVTSNGGHGKLIGAYANGTAVSMMNAYKDTVLGTGTGPDIKTKSSTTKGKTTNNDNNNDDKTKSSSKTLIDWIERKLDVLKTKADRWATIIENATDPDKISKYYDKLEANYKKQVKTTYDAAERYSSKAKSIKLDNKYKKLVQAQDTSLFKKDGNLKSYKTLLAKYGEKTATAIQEYEEWYDKYQDAVDSYIEACTNLANAPLEEAAAKIEKLTDAIDLIDTKVENAIGSKNKNKLLDQKLAKQTEITKASYVAKKDADVNLKSAKGKLNSEKDLKKYSDLNKSEKSKVLDAVKNNKEIDLTYFKANSKGYKDALAYNTALKARNDAVSEYNSNVQEEIALRREIEKQKFDNIADDYDKKISLLDHGTTYLENRIAEVEAAGQNAHIGYYKQEIKIEKQKKAALEEESKSLEKQLAEIPKGTDEWYDAYDALQDVNSQISEATQNIYKYNDAINEAQFNLFEKTTEQLGRIQEENEFLRKMMSHEKSFDEETGQFTEAGLANLQTLTEDYYVANSKSSKADKTLATLLQMKASGTLEGNGYSFNSMDSLNEAIDDYYDKVRTYKEEEYEAQEAIYNLMEESYNSQLDAMKELIDDKVEALNLEKDLYDYTKQISDKTKNIATLEKQLAVYQGDTSEEGRAKAQKLQVELNEAKKDLEETEYDRYLSDQEDMLNNMYEEYEELMKKKLDDFMAVVKEGMEKAEDNASTSNKYLSNLKTNLGYTEEFDKSHVSQDNIKSAIETECGKIVNAVKAASGTTGSTPSDADTNEITNPGTQTTANGTNAGNTGDSSAGSSAQTSSNGTDSTDKKTLLNIAKDYIAAKASNPKKEKKDYKYVNQKIWDYTKGNKKKGKVLSDSELKELAGHLGVKYNNSSKTGNLAKKLSEIGFKGFSTGGKVVSVDDINKKVRANGDDGLASVQKGEAILTPIQTKQFEELASKLKQINGMTDYSSAMANSQADVSSMASSIEHLSKISTANQSSIVGDVHLHATFPNITDSSRAEDFVKAIQNSQKLQKEIQSVTIGQINGEGRLASRRIR